MSLSERFNSVVVLKFDLKKCQILSCDCDCQSYNLQEEALLKTIHAFEFLVCIHRFNMTLAFLYLCSDNKFKMSGFKSRTYLRLKTLHLFPGRCYCVHTE